MRRLGGLKRRKDSYYKPNNREPVGLIFNSKDEKTKYFQKTFFPGNKIKWDQIELVWRGLLISLQKWIIYIYQILEKWDLSQKRTLTLHFLQ